MYSRMWYYNVTCVTKLCWIWPNGVDRWADTVDWLCELTKTPHDHQSLMCFEQYESQQTQQTLLLLLFTLVIVCTMEIHSADWLEDYDNRITVHVMNPLYVMMWSLHKRNFYSELSPIIFFVRSFWLIEQDLTSPPTQYRLYGRRSLEDSYYFKCRPKYVSVWISNKLRCDALVYLYSA